MTISVTCPNGHKLKAQEKHAGKTLSCPACKARVTVPAMPADDLETGLEPWPEEDPVLATDPGLPQVPLAPVTHTSRPATAPKPKSNPRAVRLLLAGLGAGAGLGLVFVLIVWLATSRSDSTTSNPTSEVVQAPPRAAPTEKSSVDSTSPHTTPITAERPTEDSKDIREKLKRIGLAFHNFHDTYRMFAYPPGDGSTASPARQDVKTTSLSWRVHLLPFLDQKPLYEQFHLDEPWDSPHNQSLLKHMPEVYRLGSSAEPKTRFQVLTGSDMLFGSAKPASLREVSDGSTHTILALAVGPDRAVPWTQPDDVMLDPAAPLAALGTLPDSLILCVMVDGDLLTVRQAIDPATFLALATPRGGEVIDADWLRRQFEEEQSDAPTGKASKPSTPAAPKPAPPATTAGTSPPRALSLTAPVSPDEVRAKLQAIAYAFLLHNDFFGMYAPPTGPEAQKHVSGLSWRVHLLPFLGEEALYARFHLNEPWDSPHNRTLFSEMPDVYRFGGTAAGLTRIRVVTGPTMLFGHGRPTTHRDIPDGPSNTLLAVVAGPEAAVPWTHPGPGDLPFGPAALKNVINSVAGSTLECITADGKLLSLPADVPEETFQALVTPAGKEIVDAASLRKQYGPDRPPDAALGQRARAARDGKNERMAKLKEIVLAMQGFHDTFRRFPPAENAKYFDAAGQPKLSWRVHLLPFLDQTPLYKRFKLEESWEHPENTALLAAMPDVYRDPTDSRDSTDTRFVTLTGPETPFSGRHGPRIPDFLDGTSNTILVLLAGRDRAVPWTKPEDVVFDPGTPLACLGEPYGPGIMFARVDGAVEHVKASLPPEWFKALVTPSGGEILPSGRANYGLRTP